MGPRPEEQRESRIHYCETRRQNGIHKFELIHRDEEARRLKLRLLSAGDQSDALEEAIYKKGVENRLLRRRFDQICGKLDNTEDTIHRQDAKLKRQALSIQTLKTEIEALQNAAQNTSKATQDEATMTRELDKLRQEAAHLRSQLQNHQALVAEKQNLQRQLDSLEVELENEKRSKQRAQDKETKSAVDELKLKVEEAEKRLNAEKREREKLVKQHEKTLSEVCGQNGRLEERISTLKEKIKGLNVELKEAKQNVDQHLPASIQAQSPEAKPRRRAATSRQEAAKKKDEEPSQQEASIFTPEQDGHAERRLAKKRGILNAPLGEKSNFSITPFLNRNKSLSEDLDSAQPVEAVSAPSEPDVDDDSEPEMEAHERPARPSTNTKENATTSTAAAPGITQPVSKKPRGRPKAKPLGETSPAKKNSTAPTVAKRRRQPAADQGVGQENTSPDAKGKTAQNIALSVSEASTKEPDGKKKRRKILGATNPSIFDEEDGEATTNIANLHMGPPGKRKRPNLGGPANAFAAASFSPLKRDRRGVGASFLG